MSNTTRKSANKLQGEEVEPNRNAEHQTDKQPGNKTDGDDILSAEYSRAAPVSVDTEVAVDYRKRIRAGLGVILVTFVGLGGWAAVAPLDGAAIAPGQVIVDSENRVVQHLQGGIISALYVRDGHKVEEGELLLELSDTQVRAELDIIQSQLNEAMGREARLQAERIGADEISFPQELLEADDQTITNIIKGQQALFGSRREALEGKVSIYEQRMNAFNQQIKGLKSLIRTHDNRIASYRQELANWQALFERELADKTRINEMQRELYRLEGERASAVSSLAELEIRIGETRSELLVTRENYAEEVSAQLRDAQQTVSDLGSRRIAVRDVLERTRITAPATGTVVGLSIHTVGGVIRPGETILSIVPDDQLYAIRARVQTPDIDRVKVGQRADVRLSAFNQQTHDVVQGELLHISADAFSDERTGEQYYEARIGITDEGHLTMMSQGMYLMSGMPAEVMIKTGERTALQYLLSPITRMLDRALREE